MRERTYSDDRLLNAVGWGVVLLSVAAGMGFGFWWIGLQGMMFAGLPFMGMSWGAFEIVELAVRGHVAERRVRKLLRRYDVPAVHDVFLSTPDGRRHNWTMSPFSGGRWL